MSDDTEIQTKRRTVTSENATTQSNKTRQKGLRLNSIQSVLTEKSFNQFLIS